MTAPGSAPRVGAALAFDGIRVQYAGRPLPALQQVTFTAHPGLVTAVVGPNGSGKSSLVRTLLRRAPVIAGRVLLDDRDARPGVKFADAELLGIPHRIVVSDRGLDAGRLEYRHRRASANEDWPAGEVVERLSAAHQAALGRVQP
jgi:ABC-type cobalamin/Fe3+-siderophores transport system ATPase subunit